VLATNLRRSAVWLGLTVTGAVLASSAGLGVAPATAEVIPVPATPSGLPSSLESLSPYIPQTSCDPTAKPGVVAFEQLILRTYPGTGSDGIVNTCAAEGAVSEHSEGRAWDWQVSALDPGQLATANTLLGWLLAPDAAGRPAAMARRLGLMYVIFNQRIWGAYDADQGWRPYFGTSPHTDHVHFSFSWAGAWQRTSFWTGRVAPIDYGPCVPAGQQYAPTYAGFNPQPCPVPSVLPAGATELSLLRQYSSATLHVGDRGPAVATVQQALGISADGDFGPQTLAAVQAFQAANKISPDGVVASSTWAALITVAQRGSGTQTNQPTPPLPPLVQAPPAGPAVLGPYPGAYVQLGAQGPVVAAVQRALGVGADGVFGPITYAAVVAFQRSHQLEADGQVGPMTWAALSDGRAPAVGSPATASAPALSAAPPGVVALGAYPGHYVQLGSRGGDVAAVQRALGIPADGDFGPITLAAVLEFQRRPGLEVDGQVGPATWSAL